MSFAAVRAELRRRHDYAPPCPLCSVIGHEDTADMICMPSIVRGRRAGLWRVRHSCAIMPDGSPHFTHEEEAVRWWRERRLTAPLSWYDEPRRALNLERLKKDWEAV